MRFAFLHFAISKNWWLCWCKSCAGLCNGPKIASDNKRKTLYLKWYSVLFGCAWRIRTAVAGFADQRLSHSSKAPFLFFALQRYNFFFEPANFFFVFLSGWPGSNGRPPGPKPGALPTALHPGAFEKRCKGRAFLRNGQIFSNKIVGTQNWLYILLILEYICYLCIFKKKIWILSVFIIKVKNEKVQF